ncbi:hypothetical protein CV770_39935 [Bradyrhizobium sp. AC87j1]|nr:hypothetical protein CV770_39935 [Bradyrhizobium sp. AC87j1]
MSDLPDELPSDPAELRVLAAALLDRCARLERLLTSIIPDNGIQFTFPLHYADSLSAKRSDSIRGPLANWCAQTC